MRIKEAARRAWEKVKRFFGADVRAGVPEPLTMPKMPEVKPPKVTMPEIPEPDMSEIGAKQQAIRRHSKRCGHHLKRRQKRWRKHSQPWRRHLKR